VKGRIIYLGRGVGEVLPETQTADCERTCLGILLARTQIIADASPVVLGAVLVQDKNGNRRTVCYASRTLSQVERRYSQTEKEALVWACKRFHLYGLPRFELVTDHEALKVIYSTRSKP